MTNNWAVLHKKDLNVLRRCHTKRRTGMFRFFWTNFWLIFFFFFFFVIFFFKVGVIPKEGRARQRTTRACPSFGMTSTQDIMDLFAWRSSDGIMFYIDFHNRSMNCKGGEFIFPTDFHWCFHRIWIDGKHWKPKLFFFYFLWLICVAIF